MFQRIQTLFLFFAFLSLLFLGFYPIIRFGSINLLKTAPKEIFAFKSIGFNTDLSVKNPFSAIFPANYQTFNLAIWCASILLILISIFLFKSRIFQMRIIWAIIGLILILSILIYFDINHLSDPGSARILEPGAYALSASLLFLLMARRQIQKDENLVRSVDRLR